jgi:hypothetical protein
MIRDEDGILNVVLSDPTHKQDALTLTLDRAARAVISSDPTITVAQLAPTITLAVQQTAGAAGATHTIALLLD